MRRLLLFSFFLVAITYSETAAAQIFSFFGEDVPCKEEFLSGDIDAECVTLYLAYLIQQIFKLTGAICLIVMMVGGYQLALGQMVGGKEKGQATLRWGIIGMILSGLSFFIVDFVISSIAGI